MKQKLLNSFRLRATLLVAMLCALFTGQAWAEDVTTTVDLSSGTFTTDHITWNVDDVITITQAQGTSSNAVNSSYISSPRFYAGHVISFEATSGITMTSIVISGPKGTGSNSISKFGENAGWTISSTEGTATWSGSASSVSISPAAQVRPTGITITYTTSGGSTTPTCATPTFSPAAGAVVSGTTVSISSTEGATIYYTTDGTTPTSNSSVYSDPIEITTATTIKAFATKDDYNDSEVATAAYTIKEAISGYTIDFENDIDDYVDWTFTNIGTSNTAITAHGGSKYGANINASGNGVTTCSIQTKDPIALPGTFTCYVSKVSNNTTASTWTLAVSEEGTTWTDVATQAAESMAKGGWVEFTANLESYSDVYVRLSYGSSSAIRAIDDISITMRDPNAKITPTVTIDATGLTTDLAGSTNVSAGTVTATVTSGETTITSPAVTWSSSDTSVATVNASTGAVTLIAVGTTNLIASFAGNDDYKDTSASYELTVINSYAKGQENNPYTVAEAIDAIDNNGDVTGVYVAGIVSQVDSYNSNYKSITYWISDDGTPTNQFEVYSGKGIDNANFSSVDDIQVGDVVVIKGDITYYSRNEVYEFSANNQLVSLYRENGKETPTLAFEEESYSVYVDGTITITATTNSDGDITYSSSDTDVAEIDATTGEVLAYTTGTTTITATLAETDTYEGKTATVTLTVTVDPANVVGYKYALVTSTSELEDGGKVIIANTEASVAMSTEQKSNNRGQAEISIDNNGKAIVESGSSVQVFTLEVAPGSQNLCYFNTGNGYIYSPVTSGNYLRTQTDKDDNAAARVTFEEGVTNIVFVKSSNSTVLQYNSGSSLFSCYSSASQKPVELYKQMLQTVTVTEAGFATLSSTEALDFTDVENIYAYTATINGSTINFTRVEKVPANTGVLLRSIEGGAATANVPVLAAAAAIENNAFVAVNQETNVATTEGTNTNYILSTGANGVGFYKAAGQTVGAGKAYLTVADGDVKSFAISFDDIETAITGISASKNDATIYNLAGQRVSQPVRGLYIVGGRKVVVK